MAVWLASNLVTDVRKLGGLPSSATLGLADSDILEHADAVVSSLVVPMVMAASEEFYTATSDISLTAGQAIYRLPDRNVGGKLRDLSIIQGGLIIKIPRVEPEDAAGWVTNAQGFPVAFYLQAGNVVLLPAPTGQATMRLTYFVAPSRLTTDATKFSAITGVTYSTNTVMTYSAGSDLFASSSTVDVVSKRSPYDTLGVALAKNTSGSNTVTTTGTTPATIAIGDYVCIPEYSPVVQAPAGCYNYLATETARRVMMSVGNAGRVDMLSADVGRLRAEAQAMFAPRVDGAPKKVMGLIQRGYGRRWYY